MAICLVLVFLFGQRAGASEAVDYSHTKGILILCYHHISEGPPNDPITIPQKLFVQQIEYLRTHGYHFISADDLLLAQKGAKMLPPKPVLLSFDDAYRSYYTFVVPFLTRLGIPSVVAVVGAWIDAPPAKLVAPLMSWEQLAEIASNPLVEIASHSYGLHRGIRYTPQGNVGPAAAVFEYFPREERYETEEEFRMRLVGDMQFQKRLLYEKTGKAPRILVWPYGHYNKLGVELARKYGMPVTFTTEEGLNSLEDLWAARRFFIEYGTMDQFIKFIEHKNQKQPIRAVQVDLDLIYDPSPKQTEKNLGLLIDRLVAMKVNTVFLQAFADPDGNGKVESTYFPNSVLPVRSNIFPWACHQISIRNIDVFAWMPTLNIKLPDPKIRQSLGIRNCRDGHIEERLSPFAPGTRDVLARLYADLSRYAKISGILFQDDAVLDDMEDCHPCALEHYYFSDGQVSSGCAARSPSSLVAPDADDPRWIGMKTLRLEELLSGLQERVRIYRPECRFARNIFSEAVMNPESEKWFAQSPEGYLKNYDFTVIMAYPQMEGHRRDAISWLEELYATASGWDEKLQKTVFKLQTYDWKYGKWVSTGKLVREIRLLEALGARNIAYYPDNVFENLPRLRQIRLEMSVRDFPFVPKGVIE